MLALIQDLNWLQSQRLMQVAARAQAQGVGARVVLNHRSIIQYAEPDPDVPPMEFLMVGHLFDGSEWQTTYPMAPAI